MIDSMTDRLFPVVEDMETLKIKVAMENLRADRAALIRMVQEGMFATTPALHREWKEKSVGLLMRMISEGR